MEEVPDAELIAWLRTYMETPDGQVVLRDLPPRVDARILGQIPELGSDPTLVRDLSLSTIGQWEAFLDNLEGHRPFALPPRAADLARSLARRGMDLAVLLKIYRTAHKTVLDIFGEITETIAADGPPPDQVLKFLWTRAVEWLDDSVEQLIITFADEHRHLVEGALLQRAERIREILAGGDDADGASRDLAHPLAQWQTALVLWDPVADRAAAQPLNDLAVQAARLLGGPRPLTLASSSRDLWCWVATPTQPDVSVLAGLAATLTDHRVHLAVGVPQTGLAGFRTSHAEAFAAQRLCLGAARVPAVVDYPDVELLCLLADDHDLLHRMVAREVGALIGADKNLGLIRDTALTFLTQRQNVEATAELLFVHKNTVRYRLARAEELLGHPLTAHPTKVEVALRYVALFGPPPG
ncbi:PucR family transcriptional regulator [Nocardioides stalactiti]|uniref:PucR family transcriptional regulator n=1 Tax=Nocardioides stalactiti TaxID=2755356 RepID=UPI0015FF3F18|nr:PucR family transcriptional regulator [Nocardioides stalactiti]